MRARILFSSAGLDRPASARRTRHRLLPLLAPVMLAAALGCRDDAQSPTAPEPQPALASTSTALSFRQVSAGEDHTCGVTTENRAYCWGRNVFGELGDGTHNIHLTPVAVAGGLRFAHVSAGSHHTCGVTTDDRAFCWGWN